MAMYELMLRYGPRTCTATVVLWNGTEMLECRQHLRTACVVYNFTTDLESELRLKTFL